MRSMAESHTSIRFDPIANGYDYVKIAMFYVACDFSIALYLNNRNFGDSCLSFQLFHHSDICLAIVFMSRSYRIAICAQVSHTVSPLTRTSILTLSSGLNIAISPTPDKFSSFTSISLTLTR